MKRKPGPKKTTTRRAPTKRRPPRAVELRNAFFDTVNFPAFHPTGGVSPEVAVRVTSIFAVVRFLAQAIASMPVHLMRTTADGRKEPAVLPCGYILRRRPNGWQSAYDFYQLQAYWTALHGNGYARVLPGDRGFCSELRPMHPTRVKVHRAADYTVWYEFLNERGQWERLDAAEVLHWRWISDNGVVGLPPSELCGTSIALARKLDTAASAFWDNSARPDIVLQTKDKIPDEAIESLRRQIREMYSGARNRGSAALLPKNTELKTIEGNSNEASQFMELRDAILPDVARCWGVPSTLLGDARMARWSNVEQEHLSAQVWCLLPWQRRMESPLDMMLQPIYGEDVYSKFDNRGLLRGDSAARVALMQFMFNTGAITPNEIRDLEDLPLLDQPEADQTFMQLGFSTLEAAAAQVATEEPQPDGEPEPIDDQPADEPATPADAVASGVDLQATALNGAQVTSLLEVLARVSAGALEKDAAIALITAAFPTVSMDLARQMVDGAVLLPPPDTNPGGQTDGA